MDVHDKWGEKMNDLIYREDAIGACAYETLECYEARKAIRNLPSADRPQGKWIFKTVFPNDKSEFPMGYLVCSVCGSHHSNSTPCNYCDNCGARMKGADDEDN